MSQNPSPPPPIDLRHMTSNTVLVSPSRDHRRTSQHLRTADPRLGSRSPNSIPSSPTSIHSSSSAIFERDIEPILPPSPPSSQHHTHPAHPPNPHRIARGKATEALEQAVPSVLDSAAAILGSLDPDLDFSDQVSVVAPAPSAASTSSFAGMTGSGFASPIGSFRSRSPSPLGSRITSPTSVLGLHNIGLPSPPPAAAATLPSVSASASSSPRPQMHNTDTSTTITGISLPSSLDVDHPANTPSIITPPPDQSQAQHQHQEHDADHHLPDPSSTSTHSSPSQHPHSHPQTTAPLPLSPQTLSPSHSHPPSPLHLPKKRLSFMSYADLLSSTPASMQPLSSLTTCASSAEPPPHIPGVSGLNIVNALYAQGVGSSSHSSAGSPTGGVSGSAAGGSATPSLRSISLGLSLPLNALTLPITVPGAGAPQTQTLGHTLGPQGGVTHPGKRDSIAMFDNIGGEWEREGLGRGMEERLERLDLFEAAIGGGTEEVRSAGGVGVGGVGGTLGQGGVEDVIGGAGVVVEGGKA